MRRKLANLILRMLGLDLELVKIEDIKIPVSHLATLPKAKKLDEKRNYFLKYGAYKEQIVLDENNNLIDGYTTYLSNMNHI